MFQMKGNVKHKTKNKSFKSKPKRTNIDGGVVKKRKNLNKPFDDLKKLGQIVTSNDKRQDVHVKSKSFQPSKDQKQIPVSKELLETYSRGQRPSGKGIRPGIEKNQILNKDKTVDWATEQAARSTVLLTEESG